MRASLSSCFSLCTNSRYWNLLNSTANKFIFMKSWQRYALPLGTAFFVVLLVDHIISFDWLMKEFFLHLLPDNEFQLDSYERDDFPFFYLTVRALLSLALWFALFTGPTRFLFVWVIASVIVDSLRHGNIQMLYHALKSFDIYLLLLMPTIRIYNIFIIIETARILEKRRGDDENLDDEEISELLPIGKGFDRFLQQFNQFSSVTSIVLLTTDLVWNLVLLPTMKASLGNFGGFVFVVLGISLDATAIYFISKKSAFAFSCWKILYGLLIFAIFIIFSSVLTDLRRRPTSLEYIASFTFAALLLCRSFILFCCVRCQLFPEATPVAEPDLDEEQPEPQSPSETNSVIFNPNFERTTVVARPIIIRPDRPTSSGSAETV